jgi:D-alanine-D-alanine ligase
MGIDKDFAKIVWNSLGLPVVPWKCLKKSRYSAADFSISGYLKECEDELGFPLYIKPVRTGSSVGVTKCTERKTFAEAVQKAFRFDTKILIEKSVNAREIECSVVGNDKPEAFPPGEIISHHSFYTYEAKYIDPDGAALIIPAELHEETAGLIMKTAAEAYAATETKGFARVDIFLDRDTGKHYINEINTIPGFTSISMFPKMCENGGLPFSKLLDRLIRLGVEEFETRNSLQYSLK